MIEEQAAREEEARIAVTASGRRENGRESFTALHRPYRGASFRANLSGGPSRKQKEEATALSDLRIEATSAITPLGNLQQSCAALRAGISRMAESELYTCAAAGAEGESEEEEELEEPILMATVPGLSPALEGRERVLALALHGLQGLLGPGGLGRRDLQESALLIALPELDEATREWEPLEDLAQELTRRAGVECAHAEVAMSGHTGFFEMLTRAREMLEGGSVARCVVGGADSYCCDARLSLLDGEGRLRSSASPDGFIPGEAAGFFAFGPRADAVLLQVGPVTSGSEPQTIRGELFSTGSGLRDSLKALPQAVPWRRVYCDLNGERYRSGEWGSAYVGLAERFAEDVLLMHPADCLGDVGAASGALLLAWAAEGMRRGYVAEPEVLLWASSDAGSRRACTARPAGPPPPPMES